MSRKSKWISVESPDQPATDVARQALEKRLLTVWRCLSLAAHKADEDIEHVHQLRVASRRAMAAIETFEAFLPQHRAAWFKRQLKRARNAAGAARDFDVLAARMQAALEESAREESASGKPAPDKPVAEASAKPESAGVAAIEPAPTSPQPALNSAAVSSLAVSSLAVSSPAVSSPGSAGPRIAAPLVDVEHRQAAEKFLAWLQRRRRDEQPAIVKIHDRLCDRNYKRRVDKLAAKIRARGSAEPPSFASVAQDGMRTVLDQFFAASKCDLSDLAQVHLFRIAGKRLRYAMEIFSGAFGPHFVDRLYPQVVELQENLGRIVDHVAAINELQQWLEQFKNGERCELVSRLIDDETRARDVNLQAFFEYWTPERGQRLRKQFSRELRPAETIPLRDMLKASESG